MLIRWIATAIATLGVGKIPKAPGTWGSLLALLVWRAVMPSHFTFQVIAIVAAFFLGWIATRYYEKFHDKHDPKEVVVDELVGMWMVLAFLGLEYPKMGFIEYAIAFLLFRLFDIWKPFPIGWLDRKIPGAFGTMVDDVAAALGAIVVVVLFWIVSGPVY